MAILKPGQLASGSYTISGSFSGSFQGSGAGLNNIPSSAIVGLSSTQIASGAVSASVSTGTGSFTVTSGSSTFMFVSSSGNVGIGTTTPAYPITHIGTIGVASFFSQRDFGFNAFNQITQRASYITYTTDGNNGLAFGASTAGGLLQGFTGTLSNPNQKAIVMQPLGGNVLIGATTDSGYKLDVNGDTKTLGLLTAYGISTNLSDMAIYNTTNNTGYIRFITQTASAQAERMRIPNTGNILINTTTDAGFRLDVNGTARVKGTGATSSTTAFTVQNTNASSSLVVLDNGNVGIGTSSPTQLLDISEALNWVRSNGSNLEIGRSAGQSARVSLTRDIVGAGGAIVFTEGNATATTGTAISQNGNSNLVFLTSNGTALTERLRIGSTGNVLINTTTDAGFRLDVNGNSRINGTLTTTSDLSVSGNYIRAGYVSTPNVGREGNWNIGFTNANNGGVSIIQPNFPTQAPNGNVNGLSISYRFGGATSTFTNNSILIDNIINQTSGTGITRGIYINPTISASADWRAIETTTGSVLFNGGNVGIGTSSPSASLHISGASSATLLEIDSPAVNNILFVTGSGRVGIGTGTPTQTLDVSGSARVQGSLSLTTGNTYNIGTVQVLAPNTGNDIMVGFNNSLLTFYTGNNIVGRFFSTGNFAINTTTDAGFKLDVNGTARVQGNITQSGANTAALGYITNGTLGVYSNAPATGQVGILVGCVSNGGHTAIFTKGNNVNSTALRVTDQNIGASVNHLMVDFNGATGFGIANGTLQVNTSAQVEIQSTTKGFLPPRMTGAQAELISSPAEGLMVYATTGSGATITSKGWWGYDGATWVKFN